MEISVDVYAFVCLACILWRICILGKQPHGLELHITILVIITIH